MITIIAIRTPYPTLSPTLTQTLALTPTLAQTKISPPIPTPTQVRVQLNDCMGNQCNEMSRSLHATAVHVSVNSDDVVAKCEDPLDRTVVITWSGHKAVPHLD